MPFTRYAVDQFISSRAAAVTVCGARDMQAEVPHCTHWLSNIGMSIILRDYPPAADRPFVINFVRRVSAAFDAHDTGRRALNDLVKDGYGRWSPYYQALTHFEQTAAQLYMALDSARKRGNYKLFTQGDGSFEENLNKFYNASKHEVAELAAPTWLTNDGLECAGARITFEEIEDFMTKMANVVKGLSNAETAKQFLPSRSS